jgi:MFS family permease
MPLWSASSRTAPAERSPAPPYGESAAVSTARRAASQTLLIAGSGTLLVLLVFAGVVTTIPGTVSTLHSGPQGQTWGLAGMSLGLATTLLSFGAIADDYGRRRVFQLGCLGLMLSSVLAALAPTIGVFVAARILQGMAGAGVLAASLGLIGHAFPDGAERTHATGVWGAAVGAGSALGPPISAGLAVAEDWRAGYWVQAAFAVLLMGAAVRLPESRGELRRRVDMWGTLIFAVAMASVTAGLTLGRTNWAQPSSVALLLLGAVALIAFVVIEKAQREPMIDLELFRRPAFVASAAGALFTGLAVVAIVSTMPSFLERALHQTPLACAGFLAIFSVIGTVVAMQARRLPEAFDSRGRLIVGFLFSAAGLAALGGLTAHSSWARLLPGLLGVGVGYGLANAALGRLAVDSVPAGRAGTGSGANNTARYVGGAAGVALVATLLAAGDDRSGVRGLLDGWNLASAAAAGMCLAAAIVLGVCFRAGRNSTAEASNP